MVNYLGDSAGAEEAADIIEKAGGRAVTVKADVSSEEGIQALFHAGFNRLKTKGIIKRTMKPKLPRSFFHYA